MRKQLFILFIIGILVNISCKKVDPHKPTLKENLHKILEQHLAAYKGTFPGKVIGFGIYVKTAGKIQSRNLYVSSGFPEAYGEAIHVRGASTTKSFTAAAILKLHQNGKLNIDDFITANMPGTSQPYIPATSVYAVPFKNKITIRLLLQHRAGVFDVTNTDIPDTVNAPYAGQRYFDYVKAQQGEDHTFTFAELINVVAQHQLSYFEPNAAFHYSNTGYNLLATIIERVSGKRYDQFLQDEFLTPLQMNHTRFPYLGTDQDMPDPHVNCWLKVNNELIELDKDNVSFAVSEGNIITTPADLATWANALYATNTILNAELHAEMIKGIPTNEIHVSYGLGTERNPPDLGYGHNGARPAYITTMRYHPESNTCYVLVCNFMDFDNFLAQGADMDEIVREAIRAVEDSK